MNGSPIAARALQAVLQSTTGAGGSRMHEGCAARSTPLHPKIFSLHEDLKKRASRNQKIILK
jgi:hypothetical protein